MNEENNQNYYQHNERAFWDRPMLKEYAKNALRRFYWKAVVACMIVALLTGGLVTIKENFNDVQNIVSQSANVIQQDGTVESIAGGLGNFLASSIAVTIAAVIALVGAVLGMIYSIFVSNTLEVGLNRYMLENRSFDSPITRIFSAFTGGNYGNVVKTQFLRNLYIFLWSLLLVIPGIVKAYEYSMIPYILAENPDIPSERAFELSREMTRGRKMDLFLFELSFIGWHLLGSILIIGGLFVEPYVQAARAELYCWMRYDALTTGYAYPAELNGSFNDGPQAAQWNNGEDQ